MIDVSKLPAVRAQLEQDAAAKKQPAPPAQVAAIEYARAPDAGGAQSSAGRAPAVQRSTR